MPGEIINEKNMDDALKALGQGFTPKEVEKINRSGILPFKRGLIRNSSVRKHTYPLTKQFIEKFRTNYGKEWEPIEKTIVLHKRPDGTMEVGFSKDGKEAYISRFLNDGWDVRNQLGGPYRHVTGEHFWEKTEADEEKYVKEAELEALKEVMHKRGLPK